MRLHALITVRVVPLHLRQDHTAEVETTRQSLNTCYLSVKILKFTSVMQPPL